MAIHSPEELTTVRSIFAGSKGFSSFRATLFDGDTSSSEINLDDVGEYICKDDGWDEGRISVDVAACATIGDAVILEVEAPLWRTEGSED